MYIVRLYYNLHLHFLFLSNRLSCCCHIVTFWLIYHYEQTNEEPSMVFIAPVNRLLCRRTNNFRVIVEHNKLKISKAVWFRQLLCHYRNIVYRILWGNLPQKRTQCKPRTNQFADESVSWSVGKIAVPAVRRYVERRVVAKQWSASVRGNRITFKHPNGILIRTTTCPLNFC